jgi:colicin import membrane protein
MKIRLDRPVYEVELVSLNPPAPPKAVPKAKPKPKPKAAKPKPPEKPKVAAPAPKPKPKPKPKAISAKKKPTPPKPKPKAKPELTPEEIRRQALQTARKEAAREKPKPKPEPPKPSKEELEQEELDKLMAAMKKQTAEEAPAGDNQGQVASAVMATYGSLVKAAVRPNWRFPMVNPNLSLSAVVEIDVAPGGEIIGYSLERSSGRADFDASVLKAIAETESLPAPPRGLGRLEITFNSQELM